MQAVKSGVGGERSAGCLPRPTRWSPAALRPCGHEGRVSVVIRRIVLLAVLGALALVTATPIESAPDTVLALHASYPTPPARLVRVAKHVFRSHWRTAVCVSYHESGYNTWSVVAGSSWSRTGDHGWWQINYVTWRRKGEKELAFHIRLRPLLANALEARSISSGGTNWYPWTVYRNGNCRGLG